MKTKGLQRLKMYSKYCECSFSLKKRDNVVKGYIRDVIYGGPLLDFLFCFAKIYQTPSVTWSFSFKLWSMRMTQKIFDVWKFRSCVNIDRVLFYTHMGKHFFCFWSDCWPFKKISEWFLFWPICSFPAFLLLISPKTNKVGFQDSHMDFYPFQCGLFLVNISHRRCEWL